VSASIEALQSELAELREAHAALLARFEATEQNVPAAAAVGAPDGISRRDLMRRGGLAAIAGLGMAAAGAIAVAAPASAANDDALLAGDTNTATVPTALVVSDSYGPFNYGFGVIDHGLGAAPADASVLAHANGTYGHAILGYQQSTGTGVLGLAAGKSSIGVSGVAQASGSIGVTGYCQEPGGRGGQFTGAAAQVRLAPSTALTHPAKGRTGDLFVDRSHRLWFCKGGAIWKQIA
jgi:hypothetical protein